MPLAEEAALDEVRLPDLETIRRFSIAVRQEHAPLEDVLEALRADLARLEPPARTRRAPAESAKPRSSRSRTR